MCWKKRENHIKHLTKTRGKKKKKNKEKVVTNVVDTSPTTSITILNTNSLNIQIERQKLKVRENFKNQIYIAHKSWLWK